MRLLKYGVLALALASGYASPLAAKIYRCSVAPFSDDSKIPRQLLFRFNKPLTQAEILDKDLANLSSIGVKRYSANSVVMSWTMGIRVPSGRANFHADRFRVIFNIENLKMSVQVAEVGDDNKWIRGAGRCQLVQPRPLSPTYQQIAGVI